MTGGHQVTEEWMGQQITTLADLLRPGLRAVVIGVNPAPISVEAGHYYQGNAGRRLFDRLRRSGVTVGRDDDTAFSDGIGFTDVVKRPTRSAHEVGAEELAHGRDLLEDKLVVLSVPLVIFTFKKAAEPLFGRFDGHGLLTGRKLGGASVFVMPGPYAARDTVAIALRDLWSAAVD